MQTSVGQYGAAQTSGVQQTIGVVCIGAVLVKHKNKGYNYQWGGVGSGDIEGGHC